MIDLSRTLITNEIRTSMDNITNKIAQDYMSSLKNMVKDKLNNVNNLSNAEQAYYIRLNEILNNKSLTPIQISQILNTNNAQLFAQTTRSERKEISPIREELRTLANDVLQEQLQLESVVLNDTGINNNKKYEVQLQTMGLSNINIRQFSVSDLMNISDNYRTTIVSEMFTGNNVVENMRSVYSLEGNSIQSRLARQQLG